MFCMLFVFVMLFAFCHLLCHRMPYALYSLLLRTPFVQSFNILRLGCNACTCEINICRWLGLQPMFIKDNKNGIYDDLGFCWNAFELMRSKVAFYTNFSEFAMVCLFVWFSTFCSIRSISVCQCIFGDFSFFLLLDLYLYSESNVLLLYLYRCCF